MTRLIFAPLKFYILASEFQKYTTQSLEIKVRNFSETNHLLSSKKAGKSLNNTFHQHFNKQN